MVATSYSIVFSELGLSFYFFIFKKIYFRETGVCGCTWKGGEGKGEKSQADPPEGGAQSHHPEIMTLAEIKM